MSKQATIDKGYKKGRVKLSLSTPRRYSGGVPRYVLEDRKIYYTNRDSNPRPSSCSSMYTVLNIHKTNYVLEPCNRMYAQRCTDCRLIKQDKQYTIM